MFVLHIIDAQTPAEALHNLAQVIGPGEQVVSLGPVDVPAGVSIQVRCLRRPMGSGILAGMANAALAAEAAAVHAWSLPAAKAGELIARRGNRPMLLSLPHFPLSRDFRQLRRMVESGMTSIAVFTDACRRRVLAEGIPDSAIHVVPPAAAATLRSAIAREQARQALGLSDRQHLMVAPADVTHRSGHKYACWVLGILRQMRDDVRLLVPSDGPARANVEYFASQIGHGDEVFFTAGRLTIQEALAAADLALLLPEGDCCMWSLAAAMAAGLAIVAWETEDIAELAGGAGALSLARAGDVRSATAEVLRLLEDQAASTSLGARAAELAARQFSPAAVRQRLGEIHSAGCRTASA